MKRVLLFGMLFLVLFLTGCDNENGIINDLKDAEATPTVAPVLIKRMICKQKVQTVDVDMIADFKEEELTYLGLKYEMDLSNYTDAQIKAIKEQDMCSIVQKTMSGYTDAFTNCNQGVVDKKLLITADFDLDKLVGADISKKTSIEEAKNELEKQKYSCTVSNKDI